MNSKKIQQVLFSALFVLSIISSIYINCEAKELRTQGFDVSYFSSEDAEDLLPDIQLVGHILDKLRDAVFMK